MKFGTLAAERAVRAAADDAVTAATEALILGQDLMKASAESKELMDIVCNITLVRDIIKKNGLKASYHMTKSVQSFADNFALESYKPGMGDTSVKLLEAKYVEASTEGVKEMNVNHSFFFGIRHTLMPDIFILMCKIDQLASSI